MSLPRSVLNCLKLSLHLSPEIKNKTDKIRKDILIDLNKDYIDCPINLWLSSAKEMRRKIIVIENLLLRLFRWICGFPLYDLVYLPCTRINHCNDKRDNLHVKIVYVFTCEIPKDVT